MGTCLAGGGAVTQQKGPRRRPEAVTPLSLLRFLPASVCSSLCLVREAPAARVEITANYGQERLRANNKG